MKKLIFLFILSFSVNAQVLTKIKGSVTVNGNEASLNQTLYVGDKLEAKGEKSFFIITYEDKSRFLVRDGSLEIKDQQNNKVEHSLLRGLYYGFVNPKSKRKFNIKTKTTAMGVRGTKFWLKETDDESYLCVCEGAIEVDNGRSKVMVRRNQDVHVKKGQANLVVTQAKQMMWDMAVEGIEQLDLKVRPLN